MLLQRAGYGPVDLPSGPRSIHRMRQHVLVRFDNGVVMAGEEQLLGTSFHTERWKK